MTNDDHGRARAKPSSSRRALGRALVVEDDGLIALDIAEALEDAGADPVITCASIAEAMEHLGRAGLRPNVQKRIRRALDRARGRGVD